MKELLKVSICSIITIVFFVIPSFAFAHHQHEVLGVATTESAQVALPPTTEGPGLILPDSPFFFLDELKQKLRLFFAFKPEDKAKVHALIAGERLAELRFMLARNNQKQVQFTLSAVADNLKAASNDLSQAQFDGKNVTPLARDLNTTIKEKQQLLNDLNKQAVGESKVNVRAALAHILEAKVKIEDALPKGELEQEVENDLKGEIEESAHEASDSAKRLSRAIDVLTKLASQAAEKQQKRREEALEHAIAVKNESLRKEQEKELAKELEKQKELEKAGEKAQKALEAAQRAVSDFQAAQATVVQIKKDSTNSAGAPNNSGGSSSSGNSGSSSNSSSGSSSGGSSGSSGGGSNSGDSHSGGGSSGGDDHGGSSGASAKH